MSLGMGNEWDGETVHRAEICDRCDGCGWYEGGRTVQTKCEACGGSGVVSRALPRTSTVSTCSACGAVGAHFCTGRHWSDRGVQVPRERDWQQLAIQVLGYKPCPDHKRYQAKRKPRTNCEACWRRWIALNPR